MVYQRSGRDHEVSVNWLTGVLDVTTSSVRHGLPAVWTGLDREVSVKWLTRVLHVTMNTEPVYGVTSTTVRNAVKQWSVWEQNRL